MQYEKLTLQRFTTNLRDDKYKGLTGARRAIGKTTWSEHEKARAHELTNSYFRKELAARALGTHPATPRARQGRSAPRTNSRGSKFAGSRGDDHQDFDLPTPSSADLVQVVATFDRVVETLRRAADRDASLTPYFVAAVRHLADASFALALTIPRDTAKSRVEGDPTAAAAPKPSGPASHLPGVLASVIPDPA